MTHLPGKHDEWVERKAMFQAKRSKSGKGVPPETPPGGSKLGITEAMKNALVTDHGWNEIQWEAICTQLQENQRTQYRDLFLIIIESVLNCPNYFICLYLPTYLLSYVEYLPTYHIYSIFTKNFQPSLPGILLFRRYFFFGLF